jgi:alpha-tubulin suppressor-like RCC1 family protein
VESTDCRSLASLRLGYHHACALDALGEAYCWGMGDFGQLGGGHVTSSAVPVPATEAGQELRFGTISTGFYTTCGIDEAYQAWCWGAGGAGQLGNGSILSSEVPVLVVGGRAWSEVATGWSMSYGLDHLGDLYLWGWGFSTYPSLLRSGLALRGLAGNQTSFCALDGQGGAWCWGYNDRGELGVPADPDPVLNPVAVSGGQAFVQVTMGGLHACALTSSGQAWCWGDGSNGQLGDGGAVEQSHEPVAVVTSAAFTRIAAGWRHTCGLEAAGGMWCWGHGEAGALGPEALSGSPVPVRTFPDRMFTDLDAAGMATCGREASGRWLCWGWNGSGQLTAGPRAWAATRLLPGQTVRSISGGPRHLCALGATGQVLCWGLNESGSLGVGSFHASLSPLAVSIPAEVHTLGASESGGCALATTGVTWCWGNNLYGQTGTGSSAPFVALPAQVNTDTLFTQLTAGYRHHCAVSVAGEVLCWGANASGELGNGASNTYSRSPVLVDTADAFLQVSAGSFFTCGIDVNAKAWCWGDNSGRRLGGTSGAAATRPVSVLGDLSFATLSSGYAHTCALDESGAAWCWGVNNAGALGTGSVATLIGPQQVVDEHRFSAISSGYNHTCAVDLDGRIWCWGSSEYGECGLSTLDPVTRPRRVDLQGRFAQVYATVFATCAISIEGALWCWGRNQYGLLGLGERQSDPTPLASPVTP